jgi:hypothetical protein
MDPAVSFHSHRGDGLDGIRKVFGKPDALVSPGALSPSNRKGKPQRRAFPWGAHDADVSVVSLDDLAR